MLASLLGLSYQLIPVDLLNGAHKQAEFLRKNLFGQVPALEDGDVSIFDSNAILVYLARVQIWLSKAANELANGPAAARLISVFGAKLDEQAVKAKADALLSVMNQHLQDRVWFVGNNPTIADVALYSYTAHAPEGGIDLRKFPNVDRWLQSIKALPGFLEMPKTETDAKKALGL